MLEDDWAVNRPVDPVETSSETLTASPLRGAEGEGDFMVLGPDSGDRPDIAPRPELVRFNDSYVADGMEQLFFQPGQQTQLVHHPALVGDDGTQPFVTDRSTLAGRDDITSAMVEALRQAHVTDLRASGA
jgi:hypothetical protein